jgi:protein TonB
MHSFYRLLLSCIAVAALVVCRPALAALDFAGPKARELTQLRPQHAAQNADTAAATPMLSEEQALHSLETEISRKVGLQMSAADYPAEARRWMWSGITLVHVLVSKDGVMRHISVGKSSGFRILDEQAVRVVSRVRAPSWIPDRLRGRDVPVLVPVGFILPRQR